LNLATPVRVRLSQPLGAGAMGSAADSDSAGSRFDPWAPSQSFTCPSSNGPGHSATNRETRGSNPRGHTILTVQLSWRRAQREASQRPFRFTRWWPRGKALPRHGRLRQFEPGPSRHFSRGCRPAAGRPILSRQMRVQLSPALPWGCRPAARMRGFQSRDESSILSAPTKVLGSKLIGMSSRLLIGRQPVRFRRDPPDCWQVAQRSCGWLLTSAMEVRILPCQPV
jgi:hypothetical protein